MNPRECMIVDLEKRGEKQMYLTEQVSYIHQNNKGLWTVKFSSSTRIFNYNHARLLYLRNPQTVDIAEKGLYINNKHINNISELMRLQVVNTLFIELPTVMVIVKI